MTIAFQGGSQYVDISICEDERHSEGAHVYMKHGATIVSIVSDTDDEIQYTTEQAIDLIAALQALRAIEGF